MISIDDLARQGDKAMIYLFLSARSSSSLADNLETLVEHRNRLPQISDSSF